MQDLNISFIRYYVTLVDCKKFNTAAYMLHISQPALSKSIQLLERQVGTPLLKRLPRGFSLTDAGKYFYEASVDLLKTYDNYLDDIENRGMSPYSGTVRVSASSVIFNRYYTQIITGLREKYPDIKIYTREEDAQGTMQSLLDRKVDFGTSIYPLPPEIKNKFATFPLLRSSLHAALPADHPLAEHETVQIRDLEGTNILITSEYSWIYRNFVSSCQETGFSPNIMCSCSDIHFLLDMTLAGIGCAILPGILLDPLPEGLIHRPLAPEITWTLALVYPVGPRPLAVKATISFVRSYFLSLENGTPGKPVTGSAPRKPKDPVPDK